MPAPKLTALCKKACIRNIAKKGLRDVGDFEYAQIREVLLRVTNPDQLREIETNSPQIKGEDAELWKIFIARDIQDWKRKNYVPKNPEKWCEVYQKYKREHKKEVEQDMKRLKEAMMGLEKEKQSHLSKKVDPKLLPKLPRDPRMMANDGGVPIGGRRKGFAKPAPTSFSWSGGSKTKTTTSAGVMNRARREAKELSARNKLVKPTNELMRQQVRKAPKGMAEEYSRTSNPPVRIFTPKRPGISHSKIAGPSLAEREARLRALSMPNRDEAGAGRVTVVGSDSEDEPSDDLLYSRSSAEPPSPPKRSTYQKQETYHRPSPASARPPQPSTKQKQAALPKPSDLISSIISKEKKAEIAYARTSQARSPSLRSTEFDSKMPSSTQRTSSPPKATSSMSIVSGTTRHNGSASPLRMSSPAPGQPRLMAPKRKPPVDIFNRAGAATKKVRRV